MRASLSFLATDIKQMPSPGLYGNKAVEAVSFDRDDFRQSNWELVWKNIQHACKAYGASNVTYHFPMNNSDYTEDAIVYGKLVEAYSRANNLGLNGVVVHSNRVKKYEEWKGFDFDYERQRVLDSLQSARATVRSSSNTWLGLENMPLVGNWGHDIDPLFCFSVDYQLLPPNIAVVWDVCHSTSTVAYIRAHLAGLLSESLVLRTVSMDYFDFKHITAKIKHWHFAGFKGLNDPTIKDECKEGVMPAQSSHGETLYAELLQCIARQGTPDSTINFEVEEADYVDRTIGPEIIKWASEFLYP